jgi:hypothetical protein
VRSDLGAAVREHRDDELGRPQVERTAHALRGSRIEPCAVVLRDD